MKLFRGWHREWEQKNGLVTFSVPIGRQPLFARGQEAVTAERTAVIEGSKTDQERSIPISTSRKAPASSSTVYLMILGLKRPLSGRVIVSTSPKWSFSAVGEFIHVLRSASMFTFWPRQDFERPLIIEVLGMLGTKKTRITPYHPQGNLQSERFNHTLFFVLSVQHTNRDGVNM